MSQSTTDTAAKKSRNAVAALIDEWTATRAELAQLERAERPDITDRFGRTWSWVSGDLYHHDATLAFPKVMVERVSSLTSAKLADNPNYARLCETCRSQWPAKQEANA